MEENMKGEIKKHIISLVVLALFGFLALGSTDSEEDTEKIQLQSAKYKVTAKHLCREYEANEVAADNKYEGQVVIVTGEIEDIGKDIMDQAYITLVGTGFLNNVHCSFVEGEEPGFSILSKGQHIKIKGEVTGLTMGSVMISNCRLQL
jgi:hypothetical protein